MYGRGRGIISIIKKKKYVENVVQITSTYYNTAIAFACFCVVKPFQSISFSKTGLLKMISKPRLPGSRHNNCAVPVREML